MNIVPVDNKQISEQQIAAAEKKMLAMPQISCDVKHYFGPGVYIREVSIPAGTFSIGHFQTTEHLNHLVRGKVIMLQEDGTTKMVEAPAIFTCKPGRKIGLIVEDMVWHNIYPTEETDIDVLEATYIRKSDQWQHLQEEDFDMAHLAHHTDREDFDQMLVDLGVTFEQVAEQSACESDQIPYLTQSIKVSDSPIQGKGMFALSSILKGEIVSPARLGGYRTPAGRYTNHSASPNAKMVSVGEDIYMVATADIAGCHGGSSGSEITVDYRQAYKATRAVGLL